MTDISQFRTVAGCRPAPGLPPVPLPAVAPEQFKLIPMPGANRRQLLRLGIDMNKTFVTAFDLSIGHQL
jgi:hypothetical protein